MALSRGPLAKEQLIGFFKDYRDAFPDWAVEHDVVLVRSEGPLVQRISFEALRSGAYRPSCSVEATFAPGVRILHRFLDIKNREVRPISHASGWRRVLAAMEEQFLPAVRRPLVVAEVLQFEEGDVARDRIQNANDFSVVAALNAFVGDAKRALWWCERVEEGIRSAGREASDWELGRSQYVRGLRTALEQGRLSQFFEDVAASRVVE